MQYSQFQSFRILALIVTIGVAGPKVAQGQILLQDTFDDGDPSNWQVFASGWTESGGLRKSRNTAANVPTAAVWPLGYGWSNYSVESDVRILDSRTPSQASLLFRFVSPFPNTDFCRCGLFSGLPSVPGQPSGRYLRLFCNGVDNVEPFNFQTGEFYRLRATAVGATVTCELLGHPEVARLVTSTDVISCAGTAGLRGTHIRTDFDNFLVTELPSNPDPACLVAPIADAGPDQQITADDQCEALAALDGSGSIGPLGDELIFDWNSDFGPASGSEVEYLLPVGSHPFELTVADEDGDTDSDQVIVNVIDSSPPTIDLVEAIPNVLWPPNHKMVAVEISPVASDNCEPALSCEIVDVGSDEPIDASGSNNTQPDWEVTGPLAVNLRAERQGGGDGRTYSIQIACPDSNGNLALGSVDVLVPHSMN